MHRLWYYLPTILSLGPFTAFKAYGVLRLIFICFQTRKMHLEVTGAIDMTLDVFSIFVGLIDISLNRLINGLSCQCSFC